MAGSIPLSLSQQFDNLGNRLSGGLVYFIQAGTVGTPQNAFQDAGLTLPWANPYTLLESARLPLLYFADGYIKVRITDSTGTQIFTQDNIPVTGFSTGGGGGGTIDPTTVLQSGQLIAMHSTGILTGFVRANARTIGNASSGATERANADTSALFSFLYSDPNLTISTGRGANAAADYAANKTLALPDYRGRTIAGLDDMGNTAAGRLTSTYFGTSAIVLGAAGGTESRTLSIAQLPVVTPAGTIGNVVSGTVSLSDSVGGTVNGLVRGTTVGTNNIPAFVAPVVTSTFTGTSFGSGNAHATASPAMLATIYLKL